MPVDKQVLLRYKVLNECFRNRYKEYTIDDLVEECNKAMQQKYDTPYGISKRTVQADINNLQMPPYSIRLEEGLKNGRKKLYRYVDTDFSLSLFQMNDEERNKIHDAVRVLSYFEGEPLYDWSRTLLMQIASGALDIDTKSHVGFQANPDLKGIEYFGPLLNAILNKRVLKLTYTPFGKKPQEHIMYPYYLKQYNDRWFLIAQDRDFNTFSHYALDRIDDIKNMALPYKEPEIDFEEYFDDVVGITINEEAPIDITIKVSKESVGYVKTKPLHLSQRKIEEGSDYLIISINVKPNYELDSKILALGPAAEILAPASYRAHIAKKVQEMNQKYL